MHRIKSVLFCSFALWVAHVAHADFVRFEMKEVQPNSPTVQGEISILLLDQRFTAKQNNNGEWTLAQAFPKKLLPYFELILEIRGANAGTETRVTGRILHILSKYKQVSREILDQIAVSTCASLRNNRCLNELLEEGIEDQIYLAMALSENSATAQKIFLELSANKDSGASPSFSRARRHFSRIFSLSVAEAVLSIYEKALHEAGIFRTMGLSHFEREGVGLITSAKELFESTPITLLYFTSALGDNLQNQWELQIENLQSLKKAVADLNAVLQKSPRSNDDLYDIASTLNLPRSFVESEFFKDVAGERGLYRGDSYPTVQDIGLVTKPDFLKAKLATIVINQVNIWNAALLFVLPEGVEYLAERSVLFQEATAALGIEKAQEWLHSMRWGIGYAPAWLLGEASDGCLIGWINISKNFMSDGPTADENQMDQELRKRVLK